MQRKITEIVSVAYKYDPLLTRYATLLTGSTRAANAITLRVFENYYESTLQLSGNELKRYLQGAVKESCFKWKLQQAQWN